MADASVSKEKPHKNGLEGEGSYTGTREYNKHLQRHQKEADVDALADKARKAVEGPEGPELKRAEEQGKRGPRKEP